MTELEDILKGTSRAFYLSLAVLPAPVRAPLSLAYLIARAADTIADSPATSNRSNLDILQQFHHGLREKSRVEIIEPGLVRPAKEKETRLLEALPQLDHQLRLRPEAERESILEVVGTLVEGMIWDQALFSTASDPNRSRSGLSDSELERYTFLVAGCVGPFWSKICTLGGPNLGHLLEEDHLLTAREFGKGLQWVNILRDIPQDQLQARFYLPSLEAPAFRDRFLSQSRRALKALARATRYPLLFPFGQMRHRMSVLWPLALGLRTLEKLFLESGPRPGRRVKVPRTEVLCWVALSPFLVATDWGLRFTLDSLVTRARRALTALEEKYDC